MSKRYGRNQKRRAREEIEKLTAAVNIANRKIRNSEECSYLAKEQAFSEFAQNSGLYKMAIAECSYAAGMHLAEQLNQHADKILSIVMPNEVKLGFYPMPYKRDQKCVKVLIPLKPIEQWKMVETR